MRRYILMFGIQGGLLDYLTRQMNLLGYQVMSEADAGVTGWLLEHRRFSLIVADTSYFQSGLSEFLAKVRECQQAPIIVLSNKTIQKIRTVHHDVDLALPIQLHPRKMVSYFTAVMKRHRNDVNFIAPKPLDGWPIEQGDFFVDQILDWASIRGKEIELSPKESRLLTFFLLRAGQTLSFQNVCTALWMEMGGYGCDERTLVEELRRKIEPDPKHPIYLQDISGGYCFFDTISQIEYNVSKNS